MNRTVQVLIAFGLVSVGCVRSVESLNTSVPLLPTERAEASAPSTASAVLDKPTSTSSPPTRQASLFEPLGAPWCAPPSPYLDWYQGDGTNSGIAEVRATSTLIEAWGLLWETPPLPVGLEVKMVWRVTGTGDLFVSALAPDGTTLEPSIGPALHVASNFDRRADEWGSAFIFPSPGCWKVQLRRYSDSADVWIWVGRNPRVVLIAQYGGGCGMWGVARCPTYQVLSDGSYAVTAGWSTDRRVTGKGVIDAEAILDLMALVEATDFADLRSSLPPGQCQAFSDGIDITYVWETSGGPESLSTCDYRLDGTLDVTRQTDAVIGLRCCDELNTGQSISRSAYST